MDNGRFYVNIFFYFIPTYVDRNYGLFLPLKENVYILALFWLKLSPNSIPIRPDNNILQLHHTIAILYN